MAQEIGAQVAVEGLLYITMPCDDGSLSGDVIHSRPPRAVPGCGF